MKNIYVGNLPFSTTQDELQGLFESYGEVSRAVIVNDKETGRPRGFGFVEMPNDNEGIAAIEGLNDTDLNGRSLTVNEARPREPRVGAGGRRGGGGGRNRNGGRDRR